jgi:omega-amidase
VSSVLQVSRSKICAVCIFLQVHLFDIDIPGGIRFKESETLSAGKRLTVFSTDLCKIGIGICYDLRFDEMARIYRKEGKHAYLFNVNKSCQTASVV